MRKTTLPFLLLILLTGMLALASCGDDDDGSETPSAAQQEEAAMKKEEAAKEEAAMKKEEKAKEEAAMKKEDAAAANGTSIVVGDSEFGPMLFDSNDQAIYIFENDSQNKTVCYGECAADWPPVYTSGKPKAANGADASLLGTVERRDGRIQATYAGQPLYYYSHEGPGQVDCHNVNLNGGFWWVVGPDGERRA